MSAAAPATSRTMAPSAASRAVRPMRRSLSRVVSYDWFGSFAFYPIGLAVWGPVAGLIGVSTSLWIALGLFLVLIAGQLAVPDTRRPRVETAQTTG